MGDGFYRSKDPTNSIKVLKEMLQRTNQTTKTTKYTYADCRDNNRDNKKAVLPQGNRAMPQVFFSVEVRQQHSLQV